MILRYAYKNITWVDLERPTQEELRQIVAEWGIHPLVAQELIGKSLRPKVELYPNFIYLIIHLPIIPRKNFQPLI